MAFAVGMKRVTAFGERLLQADRSDRVLQRASRADMHVDVAGSHLRQPARLRQLGVTREPRRVAGAGEKLDSDPRAAAEGRGEPVRK